MVISVPMTTWGCGGAEYSHGEKGALVMIKVPMATGGCSVMWVPLAVQDCQVVVVIFVPMVTWDYGGGECSSVIMDCGVAELSHG